MASLSNSYPELVAWDGSLVQFLLKLFWICRQTFSNNVVNVTVKDFGHFFCGYLSKKKLSFPNVLFFIFLALA